MNSSPTTPPLRQSPSPGSPNPPSGKEEVEYKEGSEFPRSQWCLLGAIVPLIVATVALVVALPIIWVHHNRVLTVPPTLAPSPSPVSVALPTLAPSVSVLLAFF